jgi:hypothetical protein
MVKSAGTAAKDKRNRSPIALPADLSKELLPIGAEALRIHESAMYSSQSQFEQAKIWRGINLWLGAPAAALAALAGSAVLSSGEWTVLGAQGATIGGILALASAALTAILTTVNASRRQTQSQASANAFLQLQTAARQFVTIDIRTATYEEARDKLQDLTNSRDELNKTADAPGKSAYSKAKQNIEKSLGQDYAIDDEGAS